MKITIDKTRPIVTVQPSARTMTDLEDAARDESPHGMYLVLRAANQRWELYPSGAYLVDVACTSCDATENLRAGTPALRRRAGSYPGTTEAAICTLCHTTHTPSVLARDLLPKADRPRVRIEPARWFAVRSKGGKPRLGDDFTRTASLVAAPNFDPLTDIEALVVLAYTQEHAASVLRQPDLELPWTVVPVTGGCEPLTEWHGLRLSATEQAALRRARHAARGRERLALETKVANFRAELQAERQ